LTEVNGVICGLGRRCLSLPVSVDDEPGVIGAVGQIDQEWGGPDIAVAAAGISPVYRSATMVDAATWSRVIAVNLTGTYNTFRAASASMIKHQRPSCMIAASSVHAERGAPSLAAYAASKAGVESLVHTLAIELAEYRLRVNAIAMGYAATDMTAGLRASNHHSERLLSRIPLRRFAEPWEFGAAVVFLASSSADYVTGTTLRLDGGWGST
jgi:NAD(P)-dependent dehydrogenase (short-subunit alcohol dehydrogenase family)